MIKNLICSLKNARDNDNNMRGGMLILSYPSIEAYEVSNFVDQSYRKCVKLGSELKEYINSHAKEMSMNKISETTILHAATELKNIFQEKNIDINLDNFSETNYAVFTDQEQHYREKENFWILSMLSCVLLDLGILRE